MAVRARRSALCFPGVLILLAAPTLRAQVFTVGEKTAMADVNTDFTPTRVTIPDAAMTQRGARQLLRDFEAEQGFAHRALPMGATGLTLMANGKLSPEGDAYKHAIYEKGQSAGPGDRIVVSNLEVKGDRIVIDLNGGPYVKHRFMRHIEINGSPMAYNFDERATGARVTLVFEGGVPELSAPELKALLEPVLDFGVKSSEQAYADSLPAPIKSAIASHEIVVGMNRRMVLAALGSPENKLREHGNLDGTGAQYEEWIYGHSPQTIRFVRFEGERVTLIKVAAVAKPIEMHGREEAATNVLAEYVDPSLTRQIAEGDSKPDPEHPSVAPTLRKPDEKELPVELKRAGTLQLPVDGTGANDKPKGIPPLPTVSPPSPTPKTPAQSTEAPAAQFIASSLP